MLSCQYPCVCYQGPKPKSGEALGTSDVCSICYYPYSNTTTVQGSEAPVQLACGHVFGATCIERWTATRNSCPLCRAELSWTIDPCDFQPWLDEYEADLETLSSWPEQQLTHLTNTREFSWQEVAHSEPHVTLGSAHLSELFAEDISNARFESRALQQRNTVGPRRSQPWSTRRFSHSKVSRSRPQVDDIWISALDNEELEFPAPQTRSFDAKGIPSDLEQNIADSSSSFQELLDCHEQWMADSCDDVGPDAYDAYDLLF